MTTANDRPLSTASKIRAVRDQVLAAEPAATGTLMTMAYLTTVESLVEDTSRYSTLTEFQFTSAIPVIGPILAALRSAFSSIAARWVARALIQQQNKYNAANARVLRELLALNQVLLTRIDELENRVAIQETHAQDSSHSR